MNNKRVANTQDGETDFSISTYRLQMLLQTLRDKIADIQRKFSNISFTVRDVYGVTVFEHIHHDPNTSPSQNSWLPVPISFEGRVFGSITFAERTAELPELALAKIALSLTEIMEWIETEAQRRGAKIQRILKEGINAETMRLLSLCGLQEDAYTVIAMELAVDHDKFLFIDGFRRFMLARVWGYQKSFHFLAYWQNGILAIVPDGQREHWVNQVDEWLCEWSDYQKQEYPGYSLIAKTCITTVEKLKKIDTTLHDIQATMNTAANLNLSGRVEVRSDPFSNILTNIPEEHLLEVVRQTLNPILSHSNLELLRTLWVFFSLNQNTSETAQTLFIHRNTLHYRIHQIEQLLNVNLHETKSSSVLWFALKSLEFLEYSGTHLLPDDSAVFQPIVSMPNK